ncbi:MAG TPA: TIGR01777 family oxidoreductase [Gammaproteobacteria bacterium]|nr:TIGR01777 family oxidoreductase [Gammaproteobacteria bacterium]
MTRKTQPKRILIAGATGFIGRELTYRLIERGDRVIVLARNPDKAAHLFGPHVEVVGDVAALPDGEPIHCIVNLAGASIAGGLWTARRKRLLLQSRLDVTNALLGLVGRLTVKPTTWINASAVGYYGVRTDDDRLHEKSPPQPIFQSQLCQSWEAAATEAAALGVKVALLRIGLVLGRNGGALPALARPVRFGLGTVMGSGEQWVSWIHLDDLIQIILFVLDQGTLAGPLNATAPTPIRHAELMRTIAATVHRRLLPFAVPNALLRVVLGELAQLFVDGQRVVPDRATALGFRFRHSTIESALEDALGTARYSAATPSAAVSSPPGTETE